MEKDTFGAEPKDKRAKVEEEEVTTMGPPLSAFHYPLDPTFALSVSLLKAAESGDTESCFKLIQQGANVMILDGNGKTPLYFAAVNGHPNTCLALIEQGADVNHNKNIDGSNILIGACKNDYAEICDLLIRYGASVNEKFQGQYPLNWAISRLRDNESRTETCATLIEYGANVNMKDDINETTALHLAVDANYFETCRALIALGADVNATDKYGCTPFDLAENKAEITELLVEHGADIDEHFLNLRQAAKEGNAEA